ncbi:MAG: DUF2911 domain-containing protein [Acidobacteriota bacterium]
MHPVRSRAFGRALLVGAALTALTVTSVAAQNIRGLPMNSQRAEATQRVGLADLTVTYHRPGVKERDIWGALVPYDQVWRAGANENTVFETSHDVTIGGQTLPAGTYGLHVIPAADGPWTVIFSSDAHAWGSYFYNETNDVLRASVTPEEAAHEEWMRFQFDNPEANSVVLALRWATTRVPLTIEVDSTTHTMAYLRQQLQSLPGFFWWGYRDAASYAANNDVELEQALEWIDRSIGMQEDFTNLAVRAGLLEKLGKTDEIEAAWAKAMDAGTTRQLINTAYGLIGQEQFTSAHKLLTKASEQAPGVWWVWNGLGQVHSGLDQKDEAIAAYEKAIETAGNDGQKAQAEAALTRLRS